MDSNGNIIGFIRRSFKSVLNKGFAYLPFDTFEKNIIGEINGQKVKVIEQSF